MTPNDRDAIVALTVRYCWALDERRFEQLDTVFAEDASADYGGDAPMTGPEQIGGFFASVVAATNIERSQHLVANHDVEITGDDATCRCHFQSHYVTRTAAGDENILDIGGSYFDTLRRTADGWRITDRVARRIWAMGEEG